MIKQALAAMVDGQRDLTEAEAAESMREIMRAGLVESEGEKATEAQFGAFVTALRMKGESVRVDHVEGYSGGEWILLDDGSFVVHVFVPAHRDFYGLERLWADAGRFDLQPPPVDTETPTVPARRGPRRSRIAGPKTSPK